MVMQSIYFVFFLLASTCGLPVRYDQRQDGELNVHAHLENFIIVFIPGSSSALSLLDVIPFKKDVNRANPSNDNKYLGQATGTKLSAPGFPAAKSPYKVDIDKTEESKVQNTDSDVEIAPEVVIAHVPAITLTKGDTEIDESTTLPPADEDSTQKLVEEPAATEKVEKEPQSEPEKTENVVKNSEEKKVKDDDKGNSLQTDEKKEHDNNNKEDKKEQINEEKVENKDEKKEEEKNEEKKEEKNEEKKEEKKTEDKVDDIPVIDSAPLKSVKASKSIDFGIEAARPGLQKVRGDDLTGIDRLSRVKTSKVPDYRHESIGNPEYARHLKRLRSGINECQPGETLTDDGQCVPTKSRQRNRSYHIPEGSMLPILQFGLSPADSD